MAKGEFRWFGLDSVEDPPKWSHGAPLSYPDMKFVNVVYEVDGQLSEDPCNLEIFF